MMNNAGVFSRRLHYLFFEDDKTLAMRVMLERSEASLLINCFVNRYSLLVTR